MATTGLYKSLNSYWTFFKNPIYKGELHYGDLVIEDYCDPIVDPETWEAVQGVLRQYANRRDLKGKTNPRRVASRYLLSGIAHCGRCGSPLYGLSSKQKSGDYYLRYACTRRKRRRDCELKPIPQKVLESQIIQSLKKFILDPENLRACYQTLVGDSSAHKEQLEGLMAKQNQQLGGIRKKITRVTDAIAESGHSRALLQKLADLEAAEADLILAIRKTEKEAAWAVESVDFSLLAEAAYHIREILENAKPKTVKGIFRGLINRIDVDRRGKRLNLGVTYYLPPAMRKPADREEYVFKQVPPRGFEPRF